MSKKTSPQSRPGRRLRRNRAGGTSAGSVSAPKVTRTQEPPTGLKGRLRRYLPVVAIPNAVVVLSIIVVALAGLLFSGTSLAALPATIAQLWLILNLVPVSADGIVLGVLPLLPAMGLIALIARRVRVAVRDRVSMADLLVLAISTLLIPLVLTLIASAMMWDAGRVFDVGTPPMGQAVARTLLVHLIALVIGMGGRLWRAILRRYGAPEWLVDAAVAAARILLILAGVAFLVLVVLLVAGWSRQVELAALYDSAAGMVGASLLSLLYLPNALIAVITVLLGSEFHLGAASISLYAIDLTELPPLPVLALIPAWAHPWSILLLVATSLSVAYVLSDLRFTVVQTLAASGFFAVLMLALGYLTWGEIGYLGAGGPMVWLTAGLALVWTAGIGVAAALLGKLADRRGPKPDSVPDSAEESPAEAGAVPDEPAESGEVLEGEVVEEPEGTGTGGEAEEAEDPEVAEDMAPEEPVAEEEEEVEEGAEVADAEAAEEAEEAEEAGETDGTEESAEDPEDPEDPEDAEGTGNAVTSEPKD